MKNKSNGGLSAISAQLDKIFAEFDEQREQQILIHALFNTRLDSLDKSVVSLKESVTALQDVELHHHRTLGKLQKKVKGLLNYVADVDVRVNKHVEDRLIHLPA